MQSRNASPQDRLEHKPLLPSGFHPTTTRSPALSGRTNPSFEDTPMDMTAESAACSDRLSPTFNALVRDIETRPPRCVEPSTSLIEAAQRMKQLEIGMLPVCLDGVLIGTVSDRDIAVRAVANGFNPGLTRVSDVMSRELVCCRGDDTLEEAARIMEATRSWRLLVLDADQRLTGILTVADMALRTQRRRLVGEIVESLSRPNRADPSTTEATNG